MESPCDKAFLEINQDGTFQKKFDLLYNIILPFLWALAYYNRILVLTIIPHICEPPGENASFGDNTWKMIYIPMTNFTGRQEFSSCVIYENEEHNKVKGCESYVYDTTWFTSTVPSHNNWVCDKELYVANIMAYITIGETVGSLFFGWFGDRYGRRWTYILSLSLLFVGRLVSTLGGHHYAIFTAGCIIASLSSALVVQTTSMISSEISSPAQRPNIEKKRLVSSTAGITALPLLYWWLGSWKPFMYITVLPLLPFVLFSWKIIESPHWLWAKVEPKACVMQLKHIAKANGTSLSEDTETEILTLHRDIYKNQALNPLALFSVWPLALNTLLQSCIWATVAMNYITNIMITGEKSDGNPFLELILQTCAELPAYFFATWLADSFGRRCIGAASHVFTAIVWLTLSFREMIDPTSWFKNGWIGSIINILKKLSLAVSYYLINLLNLELNPIRQRQTGMSLGNVVFHVASTAPPYILYLSRTYDSRITGAILAAVSIVGGVIPSLCLPETFGRKLPETVEDIYEFSRRKYYNVPVDQI